MFVRQEIWKMKSETELGRLRAGEKLTLSQQLRMIITLSVPAIFFADFLYYYAVY